MSQDSQATKDVHDDASDYGDFTLDEQVVINELLANIKPGSTTAVEPFELTDIEDYEEPRGVRLPKTLGKELWDAPWIRQQPQARVADHLTVEDHASRHSSATRKGKYISFKNDDACADMLTSA